MIKKEFFENGNTVLMVTAADLKEYSIGLLREFKESAANEPEEERWYTPTQFAKALNVDISTLWRWSKRGLLTPHVVAGRTMYRRSDLKVEPKQA